MPDVYTLVDDLNRLQIELDSHKAQRAKLKDKGQRAKVAEVDKTIAETKAFYDAVAAQLAPDVVATAEKKMAEVRKAQAAFEAAKAALSASLPPPADLPASASAAALDAAVTVKES